MHAVHTDISCDHSTPFEYLGTFPFLDLQSWYSETTYLSVFEIFAIFFEIDSSLTLSEPCYELLIL